MNLKTDEGDIIAKEGYPFIAAGLGAAFFLRFLDFRRASYIPLGFSLFSMYFFRNPKRTAPQLKNSVVSGADGVVVFSGEAYERFFLKKYTKRVSVFMSLFDVHVNRSPVDGVVEGIVYNKGKFISANKDKASLENEQCAIKIRTEDGRNIVMVQIAGLVARRIETYPQVGDSLKRGQILGLIRFGSRVDIYVEGDFEEAVKLKERVRAGETILGFMR